MDIRFSRDHPFDGHHDSRFCSLEYTYVPAVVCLSLCSVGLHAHLLFYGISKRRTPVNFYKRIFIVLKNIPRKNVIKIDIIGHGSFFKESIVFVEIYD